MININKNVQTRYMRVDKQGASLHYFHAYAAQGRFNLSMPEDVPPISDNPNLFDDLLPSDCAKNSLLSTLHAFYAKIFHVLQKTSVSVQFLNT